MEAFLRGSHTTNFVTCGFSKSYNQAAEVPSSKVTCKSPRSPSINCRIMLALVSIKLSITIFPALFITAIEMLSLCTSIPIYFLLSIEGVPFCGGCGKHPNPTPKGAPFYIASGGLNGSTQHFLEVYSQESENLKFVVDVDLSAALLCSDPTGNSRLGLCSSE